ncbi:hypothetical protein HID58_080848 [Brassica napus]|uniref:Uncharacterized protein n=1 Tax=Brassica napus TaxID=3708 RepID=A0ABQ7Y7P8_BRANA|nr:hypothetical protein HID58_080848 [Brassica napus]
MAAAEEVVKDVGRAIEETPVGEKRERKRKLNNGAMGATRERHKHPSVRLHSSLFSASSFSFRLPQREKSATKEAMSILGKVLLPLGENLNAEDLKPAKESVNEEHKYSVESLPVCEIWSSEGASLVPSIFPVQATCALTEKELQETVSKLVQRGVEEAKGKIQKASEVLDQCPLLDRTKCFETVAAGVKAIVPDSVVDLNLRRIPNGSYVAAVSVLPHKLVSTKPKLAIKPLVPESKQKKGQN